MDPKKSSDPTPSPVPAPKTHKLVDFSAVWCGPCKAQKKVLKKLEKARPDIDFEYVEADTEEGSARAEKHSVNALPTMLLMKGERVVARLEGLHSYKEIEERLPKVKAVQD